MIDGPTKETHELLKAMHADTAEICALCEEREHAFGEWRRTSEREVSDLIWARIEVLDAIISERIKAHPRFLVQLLAALGIEDDGIDITTPPEKKLRPDDPDGSAT